MSNMKQPTKRTRGKIVTTPVETQKTTRSKNKANVPVSLSNGDHDENPKSLNIIPKPRNAKITDKFGSKQKVNKSDKSVDTKKNTNEDEQQRRDEQISERKRKLPKSKKESEISESDVDHAPAGVQSEVVSRGAAKRQKVQLDVPKLSTKSGVLFVVGSNDVGQLGIGNAADQKTRPVEVKFPVQFVDVAAGGMHSVCLTAQGEVYTFGCNDEGALGRPIEDEEKETFVPARVEIPGLVVQVTAGDSHSAALTEGGQVYIWGNFRSGEGPMGLLVKGVKQCSPVQILRDVVVVNIASGSDHLICLSNEGIVYTCGCAEVGQLGRVTKRSSRGSSRRGIDDFLTPKPVIIDYRKSNLLVDNVWTASYASFLRVKETGDIYSFGLNNYNQLGFKNHRDETTAYRPKKVASFSRQSWQRISGGQHHVLALDDEGQVFSVGRKEYGRLGLGEDCDEKSAPTVIPALENMTSVDISSGNVNSFSVSEQGCVYSWGMGTTYQLGHGNDNDCHVPKLIEGNLLNSWHAFKVSGGGQHTLILANRKAVTENKSSTDVSQS